MLYVMFFLCLSQSYGGNATFNNFSVISWQLILLVEGQETRVPREYHISVIITVTDKLDHIKLY
jgi:hypothetical protein